MAFKQLSELPEKQEIEGGEKVYINDNGVSKQVDVNKVKSDLTDYATKQYVDDEISQISSQLPEVTSEDDGKVLKVTNGAWDKGNDESLPAVTSADNGKVLKVTNGVWDKGEVESGNEPFIVHYRPTSVQEPVIHTEDVIVESFAELKAAYDAGRDFKFANDYDLGWNTKNYRLTETTTDSDIKAFKFVHEIYYETKYIVEEITYKEYGGQTYAMYTYRTGANS